MSLTVLREASWGGTVVSITVYVIVQFLTFLVPSWIYSIQVQLGWVWDLSRFILDIIIPSTSLVFSSSESSSNFQAYKSPYHIFSVFFSPYAVLTFHMTRSIFRQICKKKERKQNDLLLHSGENRFLFTCSFVQRYKLFFMVFSPNVTAETVWQLCNWVEIKQIWRTPHSSQASSSHPH